MNLYKAANQWATRPDDERFGSLAQLERATLEYALLSEEEGISQNQIHAQVIVDENGNKDLGIFIEGIDRTAKFSNSGFRQLCAKIGAPPSYLSKLPHDLAATLINYGVVKNPSDQNVVLLTKSEGNTFARSFTTNKYNRIWNYEIAGRLGTLNSEWVVPPARPARSDQKGTREATAEDVLRGNKFSLSVQEGDLIAPAGLYASDKDMFVFMVNEDRGIQVGNDILYRGFFVSNNEIGEGSLTITTFLYNTVCSNHIIWGARNVVEHRIKHFGSANDKWNQAWKKLVDQTNSSSRFDEALISKAKTFELGEDKESVVDYVYSKRIQALGKRRIEKAFDTAVEYEDDHGVPTSLWGMIMGFTRNSQESPYADERDVIDRAASSLLKVIS